MSRRPQSSLAVAFALALATPFAARAAVDPSLIDAAPDPNAAPPATASAAAPSSSPTDTSAASTALPSICTDRPTKSNATCTVDVGHFQYEADIFNGAFFRSGGVTTDTYLITNPTLKYGLTKTIDLEVNIAPYEVVRAHDDFGHDSTLGGVGDLYLRLKYNFYNTSDGKFSITAIPYVKAPTARMGIGNGAVEGGVLYPISYKLTDKLTLLTVPEFDAFKDSIGDGRHFNTAQLVNVGYSLPKNVTVYGELWADYNDDPARVIRQYSADMAIAWGINNYLQIDGGLNFGLNRETPGVQAYVGISQKF